MKILLLLQADLTLELVFKIPNQFTQGHLRWQINNKPKGGQVACWMDERYSYIITPPPPRRPLFSSHFTCATIPSRHQIMSICCHGLDEWICYGWRLDSLMCEGALAHHMQHPTNVSESLCKHRSPSWLTNVRSHKKVSYYPNGMFSVIWHFGSNVILSRFSKKRI